MCAYADTRTILEHFKGRMLKLEEGHSEARNRAVETDLVRLVYCTAQRLHRGPNPLLEETFLLLQLRFLLGNEMAHDFAQRGDVILRLGGFAAARKTQRREVAAQIDERHLVCIANGISRRVKRDGRLAGADEGAVIFLPQRFRVSGRSRLRQAAPGERDAAVLRLEVVGRGERLQQRGVGRRAEQARQQAVEIRARDFLGRQGRWGQSNFPV